LHAFFARAFSANRRKRPQSVAEFSRQLEEALSQPVRRTFSIHYPVPFGLRRINLFVTIPSPWLPLNVRKDKEPRIMTEVIISSLPGTVLDEVDSHPARRMGIDPIHRGVLVVSVQPGSAAADAGLRPGDVVEEINGKKVGSVFDLRQEIEITPEPLRFLINRYGSLQLKMLARR
jgi:membrane-associated protease RseP (regulator of RpoE activity)